MSEVYNKDCMEAMKEYSDNYFELAIVDVPYGLNISKRDKIGGDVLAKCTNYAKKDWDNQSPDINYFKELKRVSKNQIIWGANHFIAKIPAANSSCWIVWDKVNCDNNFADCELAYCSFKTAVRQFTFKWNGMLQGDMKNKEERIHPTQKPVRLYEWLLANYAKEGDKILDTHGGSMSSVIACQNLGFSITCFELDKDYYQQAKKRIVEHDKQLNLFTTKHEIKFHE